MSQRKTLGIIGGIGPESTIDYYRSFITLHRERYPDFGPPRIIVVSIDMKRMIDLIVGGRLHELVHFLSSEVQSVARAGANFALLAGNTPHIVFDDLARLSPIPLVSIVEATREHAKALGILRLGLIGTRFTMQASFYRDTFAKEKIEVRVPTGEEQDYIHDKYFHELVNGDFREDTRNGLIDIISRMREQEGVQAVILGGTELPLILRGGEAAGVPLLDTTQIHVRAALEKAG